MATYSDIKDKNVDQNDYLQSLADTTEVIYLFHIHGINENLTVLLCSYLHILT